MQQYPFIFSNEWKYRIRRHVTFWLFWWLFQAFLYSFIAISSVETYFQRLPLSVLESFFFMFNHMFLSYSLMYFVIPKFVLKQKYWLTASWTIILFVIAAGISVLVSRAITPFCYMILGPDYQGPARTMPVNIFLALLAGLRGGITIAGIAAAIKLMKHWYMKEQGNLQLQKENVESQLQVLKAQVHPHFLFNTLNNIYSEAQSKSPSAAKMITKLSDLLRFMIYDGNQQFVPLSKEIKMINDYIGLEKLRYGNKLELHIDVPADTGNLQIAPLLLLPLVENCFKHGASTILEHPWVNLEVSTKGKQMHMKLMNGKADENPKFLSNGIGISNVRKRLALLYPDRHELTITNQQDVFIVTLKIELSFSREIQNHSTRPKHSIHA